MNITCRRLLWMWYNINENMITAINIFLKKAIKEKGIPFELKLEAEKDMREAAEELRKIENHEGNYKIYDDVKSFMEDLEKDDE